MVIMENLLLKSLKEKEQDLLAKLKVIQEMIAEESTGLGVSTTFPQSNDGKSISFGKTDAEKFLNVLKENQRFMKINEIAEYLVDKIGGDFDSWKQKMTRKTRDLQRKGKITKFQFDKSVRNIFWGSPNWVDNQGNIKNDYMYNEDVIIDVGAVNDIDL